MSSCLLLMSINSRNEYLFAAICSFTTRRMTSTNATVVLCVHVDTKPWEYVYVVGNTIELGNWDPLTALSLIRPTDDTKMYVFV